MVRVIRTLLNAVKKDDVYNKFMGHGMVYTKMISKPPSVFIGAGNIGVALDGGTEKYYCIKMDNGYRINTDNYIGTLGTNKTIYEYEGEYADHLINYSAKKREESIAGHVMGVVVFAVACVILAKL